ncbi:MAG TPA: hypothetical protein VNE58_13965 [Casimicrobiaceae bacterium]|nr:hypothetical protein [Casimicrobiaceae bacterium]
MPTLKPRDPVARSPLMRKGGPHERSKSAKRQQAKRELARTVRDEASNG